MGEPNENIKTIRLIMDSEKKWLKSILNQSDISEETRNLRQSQLDTIKIVSRTVIISDWE